MTLSRREQSGALRNAQMIAFLYSALFVGVIWFGYYLLFLQSNGFVAFMVGVVLAAIAWGLARYVGNQPGGIRARPELFVLLLLISAVGVFNTLMLNLEGRHIFVEAIDDSFDRFDKLRLRAGAELQKGGSNSPLAHMQRVDGLRAALFSEIRNPLNCGQGPEARKIVADLREELPEFRPLSARAVDCSQNGKVIDDYGTRIDEAIERAPWSNPALLSVTRDAAAAKKELEGLSKTASESFAPRLLSEVKPQLELKKSRYRDLYDRLPDDEATAGVPQRLELRAVESLGESSQIVYLLIDRLNKPTTYVYLLLSVFFDWMMVRLFALVRHHRPRRSEAAAVGQEIGSAF